LTQKVLIKTLLQSLSRRCLGVDGQGELVDDNDEHEDQSGDGGGKGDVPALNGSPGERLGDGSGSGSSVNGVSSGGLDRGGINELAARSVNASFSIILEGLDDSNVDEEGNDDGDGDESAEEDGNNAGQSHTDGEDELVADAVEEEGEQESQKDESGDQGHQDESLRGLGDVADVVRGLVVVEDGGRDSVSGGGGLHSVQVVVNLGLVDGGGRGGQRSSSAGSGNSGGLELEGLLESVPGSDGSGDHKSDDDTSEDNCAAVARSEGGGH